MSRYLQDFVVMTGGALIFLFLSWCATRTINRGRPFNGTQKRLLTYCFLFILAMVYTMMVGSWLAWPTWMWFTLIAAWGVLIFYVAWRRSHHKQAGTPAAAPKPKVPYLGAGLPTAALLVCLVGSLVEWDLVGEGSGRLWIALLWTVGVIASVWLARSYRRPVVISALRAFVVLALIGAIAERSVAAVVVAGIAGAVLLTLQKLWKPPAPPITDLEALMNSEPSDSRSRESSSKPH